MSRTYAAQHVSRRLTEMTEEPPDEVRARIISRRSFLTFAGSASGLMVLAACRSPLLEAPPVETSAPLAVRTLAPVVEPRDTRAPTAAAPAATVGPATSRGEPRGRFVEAWNTAISPAWLDPQENPPRSDPYHFDYLLHDALVKPMPGRPFAPSLAESYDIAPDFRSATFTLRNGIKFHDGSKVTSDDVKFTFESYRGASSTILKEKTERIELPDDRTIHFVFKEPFLDFLMLYGSPASGAGWVVPKAYYQQVGPDGFKQKPIGAGPYRLVKQMAGHELEFEAVPDYWRKAPNVKTIVIKAVPDMATRVAMLKTGEVDAAIQMQGEMLEAVKKDPDVRLSVVRSASSWLELLGLDRPDHPLADVRVRQAVSLAIDRSAINQAQFGGVSPMEGNWVPQDWQGAIERPIPPTDIPRAKQLLAEAGQADGFEISAITPLPPLFDWGERLMTQLRVINVKTHLNTLERGAFYERLAPGPNRLKGLVLQTSAAPGDAAARIRENAVCRGAFSGLCLPEVDERMKKYDSSTDPKERQQLLDEVQAYLLDQYVMVPLIRFVFITSFGPRVGGKLEAISGAIPQYIWIGPWEDIQIRDG
jgi:peptide/nickel transport system substrate-binding protein